MLPHLKVIAAHIGQGCDPQRGASEPGQGARQHVAAIGVPVQPADVDALPEPRRPEAPAVQCQQDHEPVANPPASAPADGSRSIMGMAAIQVSLKPRAHL